MFTAINRRDRRVILLCDCCKQEFGSGDSIPELRQRALEQGWVITAAGQYYCEPCTIGLHQK